MDPNGDDHRQSKGRKSPVIKVGPWGGAGGNPWDDGSYNGVREIILAYGRCINSIRVQYDKHGRAFLADRHGGDGGRLITQVSLDYPREFLTSFGGHYSVLEGHNDTPVIRSLTFLSNLRSFGPFGVEEGTPFSLPMDGGMVIGFQGRGGNYLEAIGCSLAPIYPVKTINKMQHTLQKKLSIIVP